MVADTPPSQQQLAGASSSAPTACLQCRARHLRCDGRQPSCTRCEGAKTQCQYVRSRRGQRPAKKQPSPPSIAGSSHAGSPSPQTSCSTTLTDNSSSPFNSEVAHNLTLQSSDNASAQAAQIAQGWHGYQGFPQLQHEAVVAEDFLSDLVSLYYSNFHDNFPILVPYKFYTEVLGGPAKAPATVTAVIECIGSRYSKHHDETLYLRRLEAHISSPQAVRDGYHVQALFLISVIYHALDWEVQHITALEQAIGLALKLSMNLAMFGEVASPGNSILQESWRRTWWELYAHSIGMAAARQEPFLRLKVVATDHRLPWEEFHYRECQVCALKIKIIKK